MAKIVSALEEARRNGDSRYFSGSPCRNGHVADRYTSDSNCVICASISRAKRAPQKKAYFAKWLSKNREKYSVTCREWKKNNAERVKGYAREYYARHAKELSEKQLAYRRTHPEARRATLDAWIHRNRDRVNATAARRRTSKLHASVWWANKLAVYAMYSRARELSEQTGIKHEVDHIIPLVSDVVCGLHWEGNLRVITASQNRQKRNLLDESYLSNAG